MQSCKSGGLANRHFKSSSLSGLGRDVQDTAARRDIRVAVTTPANATTNSPLTTWERDIIAPSLTETSDANHDGIITWHEWKNSVRRRACEASEYAPTIAGMPSGVDPQLFETGMGRDLPLFLTAAGAAQWQAGVLELPRPGTPEEGYSADTIAACAASDAAIQTIIDARGGDVEAMLRSLPSRYLRQAFVMMLPDYHQYKVTDKIRDFVTQVFPDAPVALRVAMLNYIGCDYSRESDNPSVARLVDLMRNGFASFNVDVQYAALSIFASGHAMSAIPLLERIVTEPHPEQMLNQARWLLAWLKTGGQI
jgi:hypothetical protein